MPPALPRRTDAVRLAALESLRTLVDALSRSARAVERRTGVTNAQLFLLQQIAGAATLSVNELAGQARTQQSTVSTVVSRLADAGLVRKARSPVDGRRAVLTITPSARRLLRNAPAAPTATLIAAIESLTDRDVAMLAMGLRALTRELDLAAAGPTMLFEDGRHRHSVRPARRRRGAARSPSSLRKGSP